MGVIMVYEPTNITGGAAAPQKSICPKKSIVFSCGMETPPGQRSWKNCFNQLGMKAAMLYFIAEASMTCQCQETGNT